MSFSTPIIAAIAAAGAVTLTLVACVAVYFLRRRRRLDLESRHRSSYLGFTRRTAHVDRGLAVRGYARGIKEGSPNTLLQGFIVAPNQKEEKFRVDSPPRQGGVTNIQSNGSFTSSPLIASIKRQEQQQATPPAPIDPQMIIAPIQPPLFDLGSLGFDFEKKDKLASLDNSPDGDVLGSPPAENTFSQPGEGQTKPSRFAHLLNFASASSSLEDISWKIRPSKPLISDRSKNRLFQKKSDNVAKRMLMKAQSTFSPGRGGSFQYEEVDGLNESTASEFEDKSMKFRRKSRRWKTEDSPIDLEAIQSHFDQYIEEERGNGGDNNDDVSSPGVVNYSDTGEYMGEKNKGEGARATRGNSLRRAVTEASKPASVVDLLAGTKSDSEHQEGPRVKNTVKSHSNDSFRLQSPQHSIPAPVSATSSPTVMASGSSLTSIGPDSPFSARPETHIRSKSVTSPIVNQASSPKSPIRLETPSLNPSPPHNPTPADRAQLGHFERRQAVRIRSTHNQSHLQPAGSGDDNGPLVVSGRARPGRRATVAALHIDSAELEKVRLGGSMDRFDSDN